MAKDPKISDIQDITPDGNKAEGDQSLQDKSPNSPLEEGKDPTKEKTGDPPPIEPKSGDALKEQNGNQHSALSVSSGSKTVTILRNRTLRHNGIEYKGGTTLDLPAKDADFLIKHHYAVAGSVLPEGGIIIPKTHIPKAGSDVG